MALQVRIQQQNTTGSVLFFFRRNISVIFSRDILVILQLYQNSPQKCFLAYIFKHSDGNDLISFSHFKNVSDYDRRKAGTNV